MEWMLIRCGRVRWKQADPVRRGASKKLQATSGEKTVQFLASGSTCMLKGENITQWILRIPETAYWTLTP